MTADEMELKKDISMFEPLKGILLTYFMPETCYDEFFLNFNFLNGKCQVSAYNNFSNVSLSTGSSAKYKYD